MSHEKQRRFTWRRTATVLMAGAIALTAAGCASVDAGKNTSGTVAPVAQDANAPITVWVDATRQPMAEAFAKKYPSPAIKIVTIDQNAQGADSLQAKIALADKAGKGWPDVIWSSQTTDSSWAGTGPTPYAATLNNGLISEQKLKAFQGTALDPCTVDGKVVCLRNDLAQNVLWYNKTLMDQFGYTVPTTWEEFQALGTKLVAEHPGYVMGTVGDQAPMQYFWGAGCPANVLKGNVFSSNTADANCVKMAKLLDAMVADKSLTTDSVFAGTTYLNTYGQKTLMAVGPSWYGKYLFADYLKVPAGQMAAAAPLQWEGASNSITGNVGGGTWFASSHSKNLKLAAKFLDYVATDIDLQSNAPTYPAYGPAAVAWLKNSANTTYFASDVAAVFQQAANEVWGGWSESALVDQNQIWTGTILPQVLKGQSIESQLPSWQDTAQKRATANGYEVKK